MPHIHSTSSKPATAVLIVALAGLALAACGSSSKGSSSTSGTTSASASVTTAAGARGAIAGRFAALRDCLQKNGITPPKRTQGQHPSPGAGDFLGGLGAPQRPQGMTSARYEAILKKCSAGFLRGGLPGGGSTGIGSRLRSPAITRALTKFATCMRENGVPVPAPNTSGKGPIFNTKGLNVRSAAFRAAAIKCRSDLSGAFRARPGAAGAPG